VSGNREIYPYTCDSTSRCHELVVNSGWRCANQRELPRYCHVLVSAPEVSR